MPRETDSQRHLPNDDNRFKRLAPTAAKRFFRTSSSFQLCFLWVSRRDIVTQELW